MTTFGDQVYQLGGVPVGGDFTTGDVWFVHATTGSNSNDGKKPSTAFASLDYAIGNCTATKGDIIYLMPGHAETTTAIALDVAGVSIIGLGRGRARPALTATAAATDLINITVANCYFRNVRLVGAASDCTALVDLSTAANDTIFEGCFFEQAEEPLYAITLNADRCEWHNCVWTNSVNGADASIAVETTTKDCIVKDCMFNYGLYGLDLAAIYGPGDPLPEADGWIVDGCTFLGMEVACIDINSSTVANIGSIISNSTVGAAADTEDMDTLFDLACFGAINVKCTDNPDSRGVQAPLVTPA